MTESIAAQKIARFGDNSKSVSCPEKEGLLTLYVLLLLIDSKAAGYVKVHSPKQLRAWRVH